MLDYLVPLLAVLLVVGVLSFVLTLAYNSEKWRRKRLRRRRHRERMARKERTGSRDTGSPQ
jgi:hypothetical protein